MIQKISSAEIAQVLNDGAHVLLAKNAECEALRQKVAMLERRREAEKLASSMHAKGIELDVSFRDLAAHLEKEAENGHLPEIQRAVEMLTPNMGIKTASLTSGDDRRSSGLHPFEQFLLDGLVGEVG
jgi:hypothetical protein